MPTANFCRVISVEAQPGQSGNARNAFEESILPALKAHEGFVACQLLTQPGSRLCMLITWWQNCADPGQFIEANVGHVQPFLSQIQQQEIVDTTKFDISFQDPAPGFDMNWGGPPSQPQPDPDD